MIIPIRTNRSLKRTPWVNIGLIVTNILIFLYTRADIDAIRQVRGPFDLMIEKFPVYDFYLHPHNPSWYQFFTSMFLHADFAHLFGNMIFLYVFGNNMEDRFGPIGYLAFYLAGGVFSGLGHVAFSDVPALGASGAVSAVTGGFFALFPLTEITVFYWIVVLIGAFELPSMYLILFQFGQDVIYKLLNIGHVAYMAHISGNIFGFLVGMALLATRIMPREPWDFLAMLRRWNQRRQLSSMSKRGFKPWEHSVSESILDPENTTEEQQKIMNRRARILSAFNDGDHVAAVDNYRRLIEEHPEQTLPRDAQLDVANHAMTQQKFPLAAHAYESFINAYGRDHFAEEVRLILGLIYARYVPDVQRARLHLAAAAERHSDPARRELARTTLLSLTV